MPPESGAGNRRLDNLRASFSDEERYSQISQLGSGRSFIVKQWRVKSRPKESKTSFCIPYVWGLPCPTGTPASPRHPSLYLHHFLRIVYADIYWKEEEEEEEVVVVVVVVVVSWRL